MTAAFGNKTTSRAKLLSGLFTMSLLSGVVLSAFSLAFAYDYNNNASTNPYGYNNNAGANPYGYSNNNYNASPIQGRVVSAPAGMPLSATVTQEISSEFARVGDRFVASLSNDIAAGGAIIVPAGSQLEGQVVSVVSAGRAGRNGQLDVRFMSALLPNGQRVPMMAKIMTEDGTGLLKGGSVGGRAGKAALTTAGGAAAGALLGTALGPLSGGKVGKGAIYGTAVGAGLGGVGALVNKGQDAILKSGTPLQVVLEQPLTASPYTGGSYSAPAQGQYQPQGGFNNYGGGSYAKPNYNNALPPMSNY
ncbi:MAG: hypothetical protein VKK59_00755 [Vampirovibrionales bacterium]|nr:hypothetical protein [Vampirovibrionales bacterium]